MTDREKLIALVYEGKMKRIDICADIEDCGLCEHDVDGEHCCDGVVADHLLANGVVVREKGEWGNPVKVDAEHNGYKCSKCGEFGAPCWHFCPNCGADMRKGENDG